MKQRLSTRARFGTFTLDVRAGELYGNGQSAILPGQVFQVLLLLVEREGELVTRDELKKTLWPNDTVVEFEHGINNTIKKLRRALDDAAEQPRYIGTIPRRGYRLLVPVEWEEEDGDASAGEPGGSADSRRNTETVTIASLKIGRLTGKVVSHYRVLEITGGGGMGLVYRAEDLKLGRAVALKFLPEEVGEDSLARERFEREARAVSALNHPNICSIYEFDEHEGHPFLVMEFLEGKTLRDHLAAGRFRLTEKSGLEIAIQVAAGLEAAHEKNIIHRDIKPANIFVTGKNVAKILDFGVAKMLQTAEAYTGADFVPNAEFPADPPRHNGGQPKIVHEALTRTGMKLGTAGYMSPEQIRGEVLDARSDIFSFGLVLYEMATGERAFTGETEAILHDAIQYRDAKPVRQSNPEIAPKLEVIINKALEKDRERRWQSAAEMRAALEHLKQTEPHPRTNAGRRPWKWGVAVAVLIIAVTASALYWRSQTRIMFTDKDTIVVAHIQNLTGDSVMDDALDLPLNNTLRESPYLTVLYPSKVRDVLKLMNVSNVPRSYAPNGMKLTPDLARQVCVRSGGKAFITASIVNEGNSYRITLRAQDCVSGRTLARVESETNDRNQIVHTTGVAGHELRRKLGEPEDWLRKYNTPAENDTSWSLEALQALTEGVRLRLEQGMGSPAAIPQLKRAVELDPNLAVAWLNLSATTSDSSGEHSPGRSSLEKAFSLRERLNQRDRWFVESVYYGMTRQLERAVATGAESLQTYPADPTLLRNLGDTLNQLGPSDQAVELDRKAARLEPTQLSYHTLLMQLVFSNRLEEAGSVLDEASRHGFDNGNLRAWRYMLALLRQDEAGMQEQLAAARNMPDGKEWALLQPGHTAIYRGQFREAQRVYSAARKELRWPPANPPDDVVAHTALGEVETGRATLAQRTVEDALKAAPSDPEMRATIALVLARAGAIDEAEKLAKSLELEFPSATLVQNFKLPAIRAAIALHKKQPAQAIDILKPVLRYDLAVPNNYLVLYPACLRGMAYLQLDKGKEAATEFQKVVDHDGMARDMIIAPLSRLQLGRAQAMMGDKEAARKSYQEFLAMWKDADADIPIYRQAKAEYAKLERAGDSHLRAAARH